MPCSFGLLPHPRSGAYTLPSGPLGVTMNVRWIPVVTARVQPEPAVPDAVRTRHGPTPLRHGGSGPVWSRTPAALRSFATKDRSGRPGTVRPMSAVDLLRRWSLRALLAEGLREVGNALVADEDQRDDREGGRIPHRVLCAEKHAPVGPPAERAFEPGRVRRGSAMISDFSSSSVWR